MKVAILMATFNGEKYLDKQIASILNQTLSSFILYIRDDGSTDHTKALLSQWAQSDTRIHLLEGTPARLGVKGNFEALLKGAKLHDYYFFADQDDIWYPPKLAVMVAKMEALAQERGQEVPVVVHSDMEGVSAEGAPLFPSYWRWAHLNPSVGNSFNRLLVQNCVTGAAMGFNQALRSKIECIPPAATMHDAWLALVAAAFGQVVALPERLIAYRQHTDNVMGAKRYSLLKGLRNWSWGKDKNRPNLEQAAAFYACFGLTLATDKQQIIRAYLSQSRRQWIKHRLFKHGILRNIQFYTGNLAIIAR